MDEFEQYLDLHNENTGLNDSAGTSNIGKQSWIERLRVFYLQNKYFDKFGDNNSFKKNVSIRKTNGAVLEIGSNCTFDDGSVLLLTKPNPRLYIGNSVTFGRGCIISIKDTLHIGSFTLIGPYVQITDSNHNIKLNNLIKYQRATIKPVKIGSDCWIGSGARVLSGVNIGKGAVIGANAVVTNDIPDFAIAVGCPARVIKYRS